MTALPHYAGARRDGRAVVYLAAAAAGLLHVAALFVPLPSRQAAVPPRPAIRETPRITRFDLPPPPPREPAPARVPRRQRMPVPMRYELDTDPIREPDTPSAELSADPAVIDLPPSVPVAPPKRPAVLDESTDGLVPPVAMPGHEQPVYPRMSVLARQQGTVVLSAVITEQGNVGSIEVLRAPLPEMGMSQAAIDAVSRWEYTPGRLDGRPVAVRLTVIVDFVLN